MHEYAVYLHARDDGELLHYLGMTDFPAWATQPSIHAETFIEAVNKASVYAPTATELALDETRRPPGRLQSATQRARERPRRRISSLEERTRSLLALSATNTHRRRHATCNTNSPHILCVFTSFLARVNAFWRSMRMRPP